MRSEAPQPWADAMVKAGAVSPQGRPSITRLAGMAGVAVETARRLIQGKGSTDATIGKVAEALNMDVREVSGWAGRHRPVLDPYIVPGEAHLMTERQRAAITELIRAMTEPNRVVHRKDR